MWALFYTYVCRTYIFLSLTSLKVIEEPYRVSFHCFNTPAEAHRSDGDSSAGAQRPVTKGKMDRGGKEYMKRTRVVKRFMMFQSCLPLMLPLGALAHASNFPGSVTVATCPLFTDRTCAVMGDASIPTEQIAQTSSHRMIRHVFTPSRLGRSI